MYVSILEDPKWQVCLFAVSRIMFLQLVGEFLSTRQWPHLFADRWNYWLVPWKSFRWSLGGPRSLVASSSRVSSPLSHINSVLLIARVPSSIKETEKLSESESAPECYSNSGKNTMCILR